MGKRDGIFIKQIMMITQEQVDQAKQKYIDCKKREGAYRNTNNRQRWFNYWLDYLTLRDEHRRQKTEKAYAEISARFIYRSRWVTPRNRLSDPQQSEGHNDCPRHLDVQETGLK